MSALLAVRDVKQEYSVRRGYFSPPATVKALAGVSFELEAGKTLAVVGESGSGKSTLARLVTMIEEPTSGTIWLDGREIGAAGSELRKSLRRDVQIVFQNPFGSLNPRQTIRDALEEPLKVNGLMPATERRETARAMMARVGLRPEHDTRYPHMFSGGQRQRIAIARALMLRPKVLVLDEPVSALDVSIRAQVLNLLAELQTEFNLAYLFISHDLSVVRHIADDIMVIYLGAAVEIGPAKLVLDNPQHPYTRALLSATPVAQPGAKKERIILRGELPSPFNPPSGCAFHPRCPLTFDRCRIETPHLAPVNGREAACFAVTDS